MLSWDELVRRTAADVHPPLYYLLLKLWVGLFGDSVAALRGFSALLEFVAIAAVFAAACAWGRLDGAGRDARRSGYAAGLLAALLLALNPLQVSMGLNTRMYALGVALTALALAALGTALGHHERSGRAWFAYLLASAAALWTHNFALFTVAAQSIIAAVLIVLRRRDEGGGSSLRRDLKRLVFVTLGIGLFYTPWVAILAWQVRDVAADYWIRSPERLSFVIELAGWASGARNLGFVERLVWCALPAGIVIAACLRKDAAVLSLLFIALLPWAGCLAVQWLLGRPLYQLRYLSFAQVAWMLFLGLGTVRLPNRLTRWTVAIALVATAALGLGDWADQVRRSNAGTPALIQAIEELKGRIRPDDLIVARAPAQRNLVHYHASHAGIRNPVVTTTSRRSDRPGHVGHLAALGTGDFLTDHDLHQPSGHRVWAVLFGEKPLIDLPDAFQPTFAQTWRDTARDVVGLRLYSEPE